MIRDAMCDVRTSLKAVIVYEIAFRIVTAAVLAPVLSWVMVELLSFSGGTAASNEQIIAFLASVPGAIGVGVVTICAVALTLMDSVGLQVLVSARQRGAAPRVGQALAHVVGALPRLLWLGVLLLGIVLLVLAPLGVAVWWVHHAFLSAHGINYYLSARPAEFVISMIVIAVVAAGLTATALVLAARWVFAVPLVALRGMGVRESLRTAAALSRGRRWKIIITVGGWLALIGAGASAVTALLKLATAPLLAKVAGGVGAQLLVLGLMLAAHVGIAVVMSAFMSAVGAALIWQLYRTAAEQAGGPAVDEATVPEAAVSRWAPLATWFVTGAVLLAASVGVYRLATLLDDAPPVLVVAHRGAALVAPENTLASIRAALDQGADIVEIDVQETADGVVVLLHDTDLTRLAGVSRPIWEIPYDELRTIDVGSSFSEAFAGESPPTLDEAIDLVRGRARLQIELKFNDHSEDLVGRVVEVIRENEFEAQCELMSLDQDGIAEARRIAPDIRAGVAVAVKIGDLGGLDVDFISAAKRAASPEAIRRLRLGGKDVYVWTVNDPDTMVRFISFGVDALVTDDPALARGLVDDYQGLSDPERLLLAFRQILAW